MKRFSTLKRDQRRLTINTIFSFLSCIEQKIDLRTRQSLKEFILSISLKGTLRLKDLSQTFALVKKDSIRNCINRFSYLLNEAKFSEDELFSDVTEKALRELKKTSKGIKLFFGRPLILADPTYYYKRSRGKKRGMQYISFVKPPEKKGKPKRGYTDIWTAIALKKRKAFPLRRKLSLPKEKGFLSQNKVFEEVVEKSIQIVRKAWNLEPIIVGDRGLGHKRILIKYKNEEKNFVFRTVKVNAVYKGDESLKNQGKGRGILEIAREISPLGRIIWKEKKGKKEIQIEGKLKAFPAEITYYGKIKATLNWVVVFPLDKRWDPLILATTLPIDKLFQVREIVKIYEARWGIETMFEYLKRNWGLDKFMTRSKKAIDRALIFCTLAFMSLMLIWCIKNRQNQRFILSARALILQLSVLGKKLTVGKLKEAMEIDFRVCPWKWAPFL